MKKYYIVLALLVATSASAVIGRFGGSYDTSDPEKVFINVKNGEASTSIVNGDLVSVDTTTADGVTVKLTTTSGQETTCVAAQTITVGDFGLCQVYGYHSAVRINGVSFAVTTGGRVAASTFNGRADGTTSGSSIGRALSGTNVQTAIPMMLHLQ